MRPLPPLPSFVRTIHRQKRPPRTSSSLNLQVSLDGAWMAFAVDRSGAEEYGTYVAPLFAGAVSHLAAAAGRADPGHLRRDRLRGRQRDLLPHDAGAAWPPSWPIMSSDARALDAARAMCACAHGFAIVMHLSHPDCRIGI